MGTLTKRQEQIIRVIDISMREKGFPPSVREIAAAVGLSSPSTVKSHLDTLKALGYLERDETKPRALNVKWDPTSGASVSRGAVVYVPLVGEIAAGTGLLAEQNIEGSYPLPEEFVGKGELFSLKVRGDSMVEAAICHGDTVVVRRQPTANFGEIVAAGIPGEEATIKFYSSNSKGIVTLDPANSSMQPLQFPADEVTIFGKVVTVLRKL